METFLPLYRFERHTMIRLEPLTLEHLPHVMTWANDPEVMGYFATHQDPISEEAEREYLTKILSSSTDRVWDRIKEASTASQNYGCACPKCGSPTYADSGRCIVRECREGK